MSLVFYCTSKFHFYVAVNWIPFQNTPFLSSQHTPGVLFLAAGHSSSPVLCQAATSLQVSDGWYNPLSNAIQKTDFTSHHLGAHSSQFLPRIPPSALRVKPQFLILFLQLRSWTSSNFSAETITHVTTKLETWMALIYVGIFKTYSHVVIKPWKF